MPCKWLLKELKDFLAQVVKHNCFQTAEAIFNKLGRLEPVTQLENQGHDNANNDHKVDDVQKGMWVISKWKFNIHTVNAC